MGSSFFSTIFKNQTLSQALRAELEDDLSFLVRSLPGIIGFAARYLVYKTLFKRIESMPFIFPNVRFLHMGEISLGKSVLINTNTYIYGLGGVSIGDKTLISPGCSIVAGDHDIAVGKCILENPCHRRGIVIESNCWIGANCVVLGGVHVAEGTVIGAGSVVTRSTEPHSVYVGAPARKIRNRIKADE